MSSIWTVRFLISSISFILNDPITSASPVIEPLLAVVQRRRCAGGCILGGAEPVLSTRRTSSRRVPDSTRISRRSRERHSTPADARDRLAQIGRRERPREQRRKCRPKCLPVVHDRYAIPPFWVVPAGAKRRAGLTARVWTSCLRRTASPCAAHGVQLLNPPALAASRCDRAEQRRPYAGASKSSRFATHECLPPSSPYLPEWRAGARASGSPPPPSPHAPLERDRDQLLRLDGELHRQLLQHVLDEAVDDQRRRLLGGRGRAGGSRTSGPRRSSRSSPRARTPREAFFDSM